MYQRRIAVNDLINNKTFFSFFFFYASDQKYDKCWSNGPLTLDLVHWSVKYIHTKTWFPFRKTWFPFGRTEFSTCSTSIVSSILKRKLSFQNKQTEVLDLKSSFEIKSSLKYEIGLLKSKSRFWKWNHVLKMK